jgi:acetyltransferase-like isoleucine patch superfamily enzyme
LAIPSSGIGRISARVVSLQRKIRERQRGSHSGDAGLRKFGAIIGDHAEIGCNCVLNPGSIVGRNSILYPNVSWRGVCPPDSMVKLRQVHEVVERRV